MSTLIGAYATVQWLDADGKPEDDTQYEDVYFSFGEYDEDNDTDTFGVSDERVFYYADGVDDLESMKTSKHDFKVINFELEYQDEKTI